MSHAIIEFNDKYVRVDEIDLVIACLIIINLNRSIIAVNFPELENIWMDNFLNSGNGCTDLDLQLILTTPIKQHKFSELLDCTIKIIKNNFIGNTVDLFFIKEKIDSLKLKVDLNYHMGNILNIIEELSKLTRTENKQEV